jgi:hypothetical protein
MWWWILVGVGTLAVLAVWAGAILDRLTPHRDDDDGYPDDEEYDEDYERW